MQGCRKFLIERFQVHLGSFSREGGRGGKKGRKRGIRGGGGGRRKGREKKDENRGMEGKKRF